LNANIKNNHNVDNTLIWALVASILLHVIFAVVVPKFKADSFKKLPDILTVELVKPKKPEPIIQPIEPVEAEPIKPKETKPKETKPKEQNTVPIKKIIAPTPSADIAKPKPTPELSPEPTPKVIALEPIPDAPTTISVPAPPTPEPEPPKKAELSEADISAARGQYVSTLDRAINKYKSYPKIAQMRGWQGKVLLNLKLDGDGNMLSADVKESSGYESLDKQALEIVRKASPFAQPPEALRGRSFNITIPITFKLENP
jgi:periplasmic protein TonB